MSSPFLRYSRSNLARSERGLTIVEIIVVLIILAIVMSFLGSRLFGAGDKAKAKITQLKIKEISQAIEQYRLEYNGLPSGLTDLTSCPAQAKSGCIPILTEEQTADGWGNKFTYSTENNGRSFKIVSLGIDGQQSGDDIFGTGP